MKHSIGQSQHWENNQQITRGGGERREKGGGEWEVTGRETWATAECFMSGTQKISQTDNSSAAAALTRPH